MSRFHQLQRKSQGVTNRWAARVHVLADTLAQRRPVWMVSLSIEEANLSEGLRAACAATAMLLLGLALDYPQFSWAAIGAFWTCLVDAGGSNRMRFASMAGFAVLATVCGGITAYAATYGAFAATVAILVFSWAGALARIWGAAAGLVGVLSATACVVMVNHPARHLDDVLRMQAIFVTGCVFATVLSFTVWRIQPFGPSRLAMRGAYWRLAGVARDNARYVQRRATEQKDWSLHGATFRAQARGAIENARKALAAVPPSRADQRATYENLLIALTDAERIFAYLIAVTDACERDHHRLHRSPRAARSLNMLAEVLRRLGTEIGDEPWNVPVELKRRLASCGRTLEATFGELLPLKLSTDVIELGFEGAPARTWQEAAAAGLSKAWQSLKTNATPESMGWRHAARVALATMSDYVIVSALKVPFGYWATMATLLILQPSVATTWPRGVERVAGSLAGALLAAVIGMLVHTPLAMSLMVFPLICATMAVRRVSYSLHVMFLTPAFVLVADFAAPANELIYAVTRVGNNMLGCVLALMATFFLWPDREVDDFDKRLADAVQANLRYLQRALLNGGKWDTGVARLRRSAGIASNNAEQVCHRLRIERRTTPLTDNAVLRTLPLLRRIAGTAARISLSTHAAPAGPELQAWVDGMAADIESLLKGEHVGQAPAAFARPDISELQADAVSHLMLLRSFLVEHMESVRLMQAGIGAAALQR
jgi:uncharacterized membrane protein YccC